MAMNRNAELPASSLRWAVAVLICFLYAPVMADGTAALKGRVADVEGRAIEGARVFAYDNTDVRRPANFTSVPTDATGTFRMVLAPGTYWLVARLKKGEEYGPLMPGDKHSGEPVMLDLAAGREAAMNFTVADLKDATRMHSKDRERLVKISGRITDGNGAPITKAYAFAHRNGSVDGIPDSVSAWVDAEGRYVLYLLPGKYFIGSAAAFPPGEDYFMRGEMTVEKDTSGIDIGMKSGQGHTKTPARH